MGIRRKGREIALQTLYAKIFIDEDLMISQDEDRQKMLHIIADKETDMEEKIMEFAWEIVQNVSAKVNELDEMIAKHSTNWNMNNIAVIDLTILRIATYELMFTPTPAPVIMNEAIEIAKKFSSDSSGKFVNGIINSIAEELAAK
jgi:N utilization substance protein B